MKTIKVQCLPPKDCETIELAPGPMPFFRNLTWEDTYDGFRHSKSRETLIELDEYGRKLPEKQTQRFMSSIEYAEDNIW